MAEYVILEDLDYFHIRFAGFDDCNSDRQMHLPMEDLSVLICFDGDGFQDARIVGVDLSKEDYTAEEAETFIDENDFRLFTKEEEQIIVPPIVNYVPVMIGNTEGYLLMLLREEPPFDSIEEQIRMLQAMDEDFFLDPDPLKWGYRLPENRDQTLREIFLEHADETSSSETVIEALEILDSYVEEDEKDPDHLYDYMLEYIDFYKYFLETFRDREELIPLMEEKWNGPPRVIQYGSAMEQNMWVQGSLLAEDSLTEEEQEILQTLTDYILQKDDCYRRITVLLEDPETLTVALGPEEVPDEEYNSLKAYLIALLLRTGILLVEFFDEKLGKIIVNGFCYDGVAVKKMSPGEMKQTLDLEPGWEEDYQLQIAFLDV